MDLLSLVIVPLMALGPSEETTTSTDSATVAIGGGQSESVQPGETESYREAIPLIECMESNG